MRRQALQLTLAFLSVFIASCSLQTSSSAQWQATLKQAVQATGYGNWIVITDASYPYQNREGFQTITMDAEVPEVVDHLLNEMEGTQHVRPRFYVTRELRFLTNDQAPGINTHREKLLNALRGYPALELEEELLNEQVNESAKKYTVFILKTKTTLPYSSIFIDLDSGYWDNQSEQAFRKQVQAEPKASL